MSRLEIAVGFIEETTVGVVLWLTHEKDADRLKRADVERAIRKNPQAAVFVR